MSPPVFNQQIVQDEAKIFLRPRLIYNNNNNSNKKRFHPSKLGLVLQYSNNSKFQANQDYNHKQINQHLWHQGSNLVV